MIDKLEKVSGTVGEPPSLRGYFLDAGACLWSATTSILVWVFADFEALPPYEWFLGRAQEAGFVGGGMDTRSHLGLTVVALEVEKTK
ncbi:MAG: hypothetical protein V1755_14480 [Chloroflexota bacterium]